MTRTKGKSANTACVLSVELLSMTIVSHETSAGRVRLRASRHTRVIPDLLNTGIRIERSTAVTALVLVPRHVAPHQIVRRAYRYLQSQFPPVDGRSVRRDPGRL